MRHSPAALQVAQSAGHYSQSIFLTTKFVCLQVAHPVLLLQVWQFVGQVTHLLAVLRYDVAAHVRHSPAELQVAQSAGH